MGHIAARDVESHHDAVGNDKDDQSYSYDVNPYKTPAQRLNAAHTRIDKLTDEVATLQKVLAAQNQATASNSTGVANVVRCA